MTGHHRTIAVSETKRFERIVDYGSFKGIAVLDVHK